MGCKYYELVLSLKMAKSAIRNRNVWVMELTFARDIVRYPWVLRCLLGNREILLGLGRVFESDLVAAGRIRTSSAALK